MSNVSMINGHIDEPETNTIKSETTIAFIEKELKKHKTRLENATQRKYLEEDVENIRKKIGYYEEVLSWAEELKITRRYIHENNLEYDLLRYKRKGE